MRRLECWYLLIQRLRHVLCRPTPRFILFARVLTTGDIHSLGIQEETVCLAVLVSRSLLHENVRIVATVACLADSFPDGAAGCLCYPSLASYEHTFINILVKLTSSWPHFDGNHSSCTVCLTVGLVVSVYNAWWWLLNRVGLVRVRGWWALNATSSYASE